jgi:dipeptide transport system substrate-binding protein
MKLTTLALLSLLAISPFTQAKSLVVCTEASPEGFDIVQYATLVTADAASETIFNRLIAFKPGTTELQPSLATSWEISDDGLVYTFHLRPNVQFHHTPYFTPTRTLNADDVLWSFQRQLDPKHPWHNTAIRGYAYFESMGMREMIKSVEKVDDLTVRFTLNHPEAPFLADIALHFASIYSAEYADQLLAAGKTKLLNSQPIGTGPFVLVRYTKDAQVRFKANPDYFLGKAKVDQLIFAIATDANVRMQKLRANECQVALLAKAEDIPAARKDPKLAVDELDALITNYIAINTQHKPLDDVRVRQAINLAIDRPALLKVMSGGDKVTEAVNPYPPAILGWNANIKATPFDLKKARSLIKEAAVEPFKITLFVRNGSSTSMPNPALVAQMLQADLAKIGVTLEIRMLEWGEMLNRVKQGEHDLVMLSWVSDNGDPDNFLTPTLSCSAAQNGENQARWCNAQFQELITQGRRTSDSASRVKLYEQAQELVHEQSPWIVLTHPTLFVLRRSNVTGYVINPLATNNYWQVDVQ